QDMFADEKIITGYAVFVNVNLLDKPCSFHQISLNHTGSSVGIKLQCIAVSEQNEHWGDFLLYVYNIAQKKLELIQADYNVQLRSSDYDVARDLKWTYDDVLIMSKNYYGSEIGKYTYLFAAVNSSSNHWAYGHSLPCISSDGTQGIIKSGKGKFYKVTL